MKPRTQGNEHNIKHFHQYSTSQPRLHYGSRHHSEITLSVSSFSLPKSFSSGLLHLVTLSLYLCLELPQLTAGPCTWSCWSSWHWHRPTSPACLGPFGWYSFPPACRQQPHSLVALANLLSVHLIQHQLLREPLVSGLHLDVEPLTTTLWVPPSSQFFMQLVVHLSTSYFSNSEIRMSHKTVSNALPKSR